MERALFPAGRRPVLLAPMPPGLLAGVALVVWLAGAAYCLGYEGLSGGRAVWPKGLLWSAYAVLPWLALFEYVKRRSFRVGRIALLLVATGATSLLLELAAHLAFESRQSPIGLQIMRRLPAITATMLLILLARRERTAPARPPRPATDAEALNALAPSIRFIRAADNYLELNLDGRVATRRMTMSQAATVLEPLGFVRIHRSFLVNRNHVAEVVRQSGGSAVRIAGGPLIPAGKAFESNIARIR